MCSRLRKVGRLIHLVEHTGGARRENLLQVVIIFDSYLFRENYFVFLQLLERGKEENWGVEFVWVTPGLAFSFFCLAHFPFLLSLVLIFPASHSLNSTTNFWTPLRMHKKKINDPKDYPPSLRWCNKQKSKVGFD